METVVRCVNPGSAMICGGAELGETSDMPHSASAAYKPMATHGIHTTKCKDREAAPT